MNVAAWLERFPDAAFPPHKTRAIESRRARMADQLLLDLLLLRGGIPAPDALFPPTDRASLRTLLRAVDESVYDSLKKDCLVYILLRWAWDGDPNPDWDTRYLRDRCIPPQFAALADAYWLLDTGTHVAKAVSILADARLNGDHVSKVLQALALSSSPATAALVVNYVRSAKPLLTQPDDIDLYALSLAHLSFADAWEYQKSFPEGCDTRERLLAKILGWSLMPTPKQEPLAQLLAFPLSPYEQSALYTLTLPSPLSGANTTLSPQVISVLQDLLCVRAIQSGDYIRAIKLDRQFSSILPSGASSSGVGSQLISSGRDTIDRKSIIHDLFATLPPAERTLLEDEIGKVATGVRATTSATFSTRQGAFAPPRRPDTSLSASWEDVGARTGSPVPSISMSSSAATPIPTTKVSHATLSASPFTPHIPRPQPATSHPTPPVPKFTAFGSPIPPVTGMGSTRGVITDRGKTLFATGAPSATTAFTTRVSLFDTAGSAKNAPNAFYKPPPRTPVGGHPGPGTSTTKQNAKAVGGESDGEDVSMESKSDVIILEQDHRDESGREEQEDAVQDEDAEHFITYDKSSAADLTLHAHHVDEAMSEDDGARLEFSVFNAVPTREHGKRSLSGNGHALYPSPPQEGDKCLNLSTTTSRRRAPPGAFHHEDEDEDDAKQDENKNIHDEDQGDDRALQATFPDPHRRSTRMRTQTQARSQPQRTSKATTGSIPRPLAHAGRPSSLPQFIPGALMDDDSDEHASTHDDEDTEMDEQEEGDAIAPLPPRVSRRTRSSGSIGAGLATASTKSKSSTKLATFAAAAATTGKAKAKARPSEVKTPARRSSRLSTASSVSPDNEVASPTKRGRKSTASKVSTTSVGGAVATRSSARRKR